MHCRHKAWAWNIVNTPFKFTQVECCMSNCVNNSMCIIISIIMLANNYCELRCSIYVLYITLTTVMLVYNELTMHQCMINDVVYNKNYALIIMFVIKNH